MMKAVRFLHVELREFSDYMWSMKERERGIKDIFQAFSLGKSKDGVPIN